MLSVAGITVAFLRTDGSLPPSRDTTFPVPESRDAYFRSETCWNLYSVAEKELNLVVSNTMLFGSEYLEIYQINEQMTDVVVSDSPARK